ncbi:MAG: hypothetical protein SchgKO_15350 [Schleiferiaceae bacterium]
MKKLLLLTCALGFAFAVSAQEVAGPWWVGGTMGYTGTDYGDDENGNTLNFGPSVGYMLNPQIGVGLGLSLVTDTYNDKTNNDEDRTVKTNTYHFQPFARYYKELGSNFAIYGQLLIDIQSGGTTTEVAGTETEKFSVSGFGFGIAPGIQYWFTPAWSMNATVGNLGYSTVTRSDDNSDAESTTSTTEVIMDFSSINFGFNFHF